MWERLSECNSQHSSSSSFFFWYLLTSEEVLWLGDKGKVSSLDQCVSYQLLPALYWFVLSWGLRVCRRSCASCPQDGSLQCPSCKTIYGEKTGTQPKGKMEIYSIGQSLPGHPDCGTIQIIYSIPPGIQVCALYRVSVVYSTPSTSSTVGWPGPSEATLNPKQPLQHFVVAISFGATLTIPLFYSNVVLWPLMPLCLHQCLDVTPVCLKSDTYKSVRDGECWGHSLWNSLQQLNVAPWSRLPPPSSPCGRSLTSVEVFHSNLQSGRTAAAEKRKQKTPTWFVSSCKPSTIYSVIKFVCFLWVQLIWGIKLHNFSFSANFRVQSIRTQGSHSPAEVSQDSVSFQTVTKAGRSVHSRG